MEEVRDVIQDLEFRLQSHRLSSICNNLLKLIVSEDKIQIPMASRDLSAVIGHNIITSCSST